MPGVERTLPKSTLLHILSVRSALIMTVPATGVHSLTTSKTTKPIFDSHKAELSSGTAMQLIALSRILARQAVREMVSASPKTHPDQKGALADDAS